MIVPDGPSRTLLLPADDVTVEADLTMPEQPRAVIVSAHGSGSGRHSARNRRIAHRLFQSGFATLLPDLCTEAERDDEFRLDRLARRLEALTAWVQARETLRGRSVGYFGGSTGAAVALVAAARLGPRVGAVVSRGGRGDLALPFLERVAAPTLLIVGGDDVGVLRLNRHVAERLTGCERRLEVVGGAGHLFEEPGAMDEVGRLALDWFERHLAAKTGAGEAA